ADGDADECGFGARIVRPQLRAAGAQRLQAGTNDRLGTLRHGSVAGDARLDRAVRADRRGTDLRATQVEGQHRAARPPGLVTQLAPALRTSPRIEHSMAILANAPSPPTRTGPGLGRVRPSTGSRMHEASAWHRTTWRCSKGARRRSSPRRR